MLGSAPDDLVLFDHEVAVDLQFQPLGELAVLGFELGAGARFGWLGEAVVLGVLHLYNVE